LLSLLLELGDVSELLVCMFGDLLGLFGLVLVNELVLDVGECVVILGGLFFVFVFDVVEFGLVYEFGY